MNSDTSTIKPYVSQLPLEIQSALNSWVEKIVLEQQTTLMKKIATEHNIPIESLNKTNSSTENNEVPEPVSVVTPAMSKCLSYKKMKINELKKECLSNNIDTNGKKKELIERLIKYTNNIEHNTIGIEPNTIGIKPNTIITKQNEIQEIFRS